VNNTEMRKVYLQNFQTNLNNVKRQIFNSCYDDQSQASCKDWRKSGSIIHEVVFVAAHLSSIIANANLYAGNIAMVVRFTRQIRDLGSKYLDLLDQSHSAYSSHRLASIQGWRSRRTHVGHSCGRPYHYCYTYQGGMDTFLNYDVLVTECHVSRDEHHYTGHYNPPYPSQAAQDRLNECFRNYRSGISGQLAQLSGQIDDIRKMVQGVSTLSLRSQDIVV